MARRHGAGLLLGALLAGGSAAHDAPHRAAPAPMSGCEAYGPNFHKVEGTDTCIRLSGAVEVGATLTTGRGGSR